MCVNYPLTCLDYESNVIANSDLQSYKLGFLNTITLHRYNPISEPQSLSNRTLAFVDTQCNS